MDTTRISLAKTLPDRFKMLVEIPRGTSGVKYEYCSKQQTFRLTKFKKSLLSYPGDYGFIADTLAADGDAMDVLLIAESPLLRGTEILVKPIGVLITEDQSGMDEKILAVPDENTNSILSVLENYTDLSHKMQADILQYFSRHKDGEKDAWVKVSGYRDASYAKLLLKQGRLAYERSN